MQLVPGSNPDEGRKITMANPARGFSLAILKPESHNNKRLLFGQIG